MNHTARTAPAPLIHVSIGTKEHINPKSKGTIKVTIFNNTPDGFYVTGIDISSIRFGPGKAVAFDNQTKGDLTLDFNITDTDIQCGDTQAILTGKMYTGEDIIGSDTIKTVGCGGGGSSGSSSSSSGGGGGGGGIISGEPFNNIAMYETRDGYLLAGKPVTFRFLKAGQWISEIVITGKESENDISVRVEELKGRSKLAAVDIPGAKYMNIWINTKKVKEALIRFKVENSWIALAGISSDDIKMYRWDGSIWNQLETTVITKDTSYTYFEAKTPGFSPFAIAGPEAGTKLSGSIPWPEGTPTVTETPEATTEFPSKKAPPINLAVIIGLIALMAIVVVVYIKRKEIFKR